MKYIYQRFDLRMDTQEKAALEKLAEKQNVTMSQWVKDIIRKSAKREKVWL